MQYIVQSDKSFDAAVADLAAAVKRHQFGVLHMHDLGTTLRSKGIDFQQECKVLEVCSPSAAARVLDIDMDMNLALPCRISVWRRDGQTRIGMLEPERTLAMLSDDPALAAVAREVGDATRRMIDEAR